MLAETVAHLHDAMRFDFRLLVVEIAVVGAAITTAILMSMKSGGK